MYPPTDPHNEDLRACVLTPDAEAAFLHDWGLTEASPAEQCTLRALLQQWGPKMLKAMRLGHGVVTVPVHYGRPQYAELTFTERAALPKPEK